MEGEDREGVVDVPFVVWDAVAALPGSPRWGGLVDHRGQTVAVCRAWGTRPDGQGDQLDQPGVTVWSFAVDGLAEDTTWPVRHASLVFAMRWADQTEMRLRDSVDELLRIVGSDGSSVELTISGNPIAGRVFEVPELGYLVASEQRDYAFAAACYLMPPVLQYRPVPG